MRHDQTRPWWWSPLVGPEPVRPETSVMPSRTRVRWRHGARRRHRSHPKLLPPSPSRAAARADAHHVGESRRVWDVGRRAMRMGMVPRERESVDGAMRSRSVVFRKQGTELERVCEVVWLVCSCVLRTPPGRPKVKVLFTTPWSVAPLLSTCGAASPSRCSRRRTTRSRR